MASEQQLNYYNNGMIPYPEPYQGMYQHQRSRALGIERRPSSVTFAIGPGEISGIQDYSMVPLLDLDITVDPLSEFVEAIDWEAENEVQSDDSDSEYNVTDEYSSEGERGSLGLTFGDIDCSEEYSEVEHSQKDSLRRSKRKNSKVEFLTSSRKCGKRKDLDECGGAFPRIYRTKKLKNGQKAYGKRCTTSKSSRPRRISARNALNSFSKCTEASSGEEDKGSSESDSSNNEKMLSDSNTPNVVPVKCKHSEQENLRNRRRLVLKSQFCDSDKSTPPVNIRSEGQKLVNFVGSYIVDAPETSIERDIDLNSQERGTSSGNSGEVIASQNYKRNIVRAIEQSEMVNDLNKIRWGEVKPRTSKRLRCEDATVGHQVSNASLHHRNGVRNNVNGRLKFGNDYGVANTPKTPNQREVKSLLTVDEDIDKSVCTRSNSHSVRTNSGNDDDAMEESTSHDIKIDRINFPEATANGIRKTRSIRTKAARRELLCEDWRSNSKITLGLRSTRNRREIYYGTVLSPVDTRKSHQSLRKLSWLTLSEHEDNCRYIPQLGDYVVYLRQGHEGYINWCHLSEVGPWISLKGNLRAMELCKVEGLDYSTVPGSGDSCCKIKLELVDPCSSLVGKAFKLTLPELTNFSDFLVERTRFDVAVKRNWTLRDRCQVWWRNEHAEGGIWWEGRIVSVKPLSLEFPESPWERYTIQYKSDGVEHQHSPWELHDHDIKWKHPRISDDIKYRLLTSFSDLERHGYINKDCYGLQKLQQVSQKSNFLNRFPVPVSLDLIKERLQNDYYRSLEALKHDFVVMHSNGSSYFGKNAELAMKMERLSDWFYRELVPL
ncbi:hypothetical protein GIB67_039707 [Kingdonia uniflora]|uniref:Bromo domain-containing protein n=1 Tax=Kingdonia uniflora TaxID=39325 RepID=A0A7J7MPY3_9MAGN|nr:hypothetical protein GIB67_039707 [Kingdonia uniflora]